MSLILDIETIPLSKSRITDFKEKFGEKNKKAKMGGLHFLTGRLVCAGVKHFNGPHMIFADEDEDVILTGLIEYLREGRVDQLITFNGLKFDLPFLRLRAALYGYDMTEYLPYEKYSKKHFDIYDQLGGKWGLNCTLAEYAWHFGLDTIEDHGSNIAKMYKNHDWEGIIGHNLGDLITTEEIYKRLTNRKF